MGGRSAGTDQAGGDAARCRRYKTGLEYVLAQQMTTLGTGLIVIGDRVGLRRAHLVVSAGIALRRRKGDGDAGHSGSSASRSQSARSSAIWQRTRRNGSYSPSSPNTTRSWPLKCSGLSRNDRLATPNPRWSWPDTLAPLSAGAGLFFARPPVRRDHLHRCSTVQLSAALVFEARCGPAGVVRGQSQLRFSGDGSIRSSRIPKRDQRRQNGRRHPG